MKSKKKKIITMDEYVEKKFNSSSSFVVMVSAMIIKVIYFLGFITLLSAAMQVVREARTCLDEKFNMVTYTIGLDYKQDRQDEILKYHLKNFEIGKIGFNAILEVEDGKVVDLIGNSTKTENNNKEILINKLNKKEGVEQIKNSKTPFLFTKSGFDSLAPMMYLDGRLYKYRISKTEIPGIYIFSASGQDEYIYKILRISAKAILPTIIVIPILIYLIRKWLAVLKAQLDDLEIRIRGLESDKDVSVKKLTNVIHSKNEIGKIAAAITSLTKKLDEKANIDQLTGIKNKRYLNNYLLALEKDKKVDSIGVILIDIDHFKYYNDTYGHLEGDVVLRMVAKNLEKIIGKNGIVCRFGGEEFLIIIRNITLKQLEEKCIELIEGIRVLNIEHKASPVKPYLTISAGSAISTTTKFSGIEVVERADQALYEAKENGRNQYKINNKLKKGE